MPKILVNDAEFYYELNGTGQPLILISGYTCNHNFWHPILDTLSSKFQVLTFDNRGCGQTKDAEQLLSAKLMADDVMALAKALGLKKPHIIGQSMGGTIAQTVASNYKEDIDKLILLSTTPKWRQAMLKMTLTILKMMETNVSFDLIFDLVSAWIFGERYSQDGTKVENYKKEIVENPFPQTIQDQRRQYNALFQFDGREQAHLIQAETLVVHGKEDLLALPIEAQYMAAHIKNSSYIECESGHEMVCEVPDYLTKLLLSFL